MAEEKEPKPDEEIAAASADVADARAVISEAYDRDYRAKRDAALKDPNTQAQLEAQARLTEDRTKADRLKAEAKK